MGPRDAPTTQSDHGNFCSICVGVPGGRARRRERGRGSDPGLIDHWYEGHRKGVDGSVMRYLAPGAIDASPGYSYPHTGARALVGPPVYHSLAATALQFRIEITRLVIDPRFARVHVRERAYYYAPAAQRTYERMGAALFVLERQDDGRWLVLAHQTNWMGFPPSLATDPMPDLRELHHRSQGPDRDAEADD